MKKYLVTFTQYYTYEVENNTDEDDAIEEAYELFRHEVSIPIANTHYDEVDVEEIEDDEDYEEDEGEY